MKFTYRLTMIWLFCHILGHAYAQQVTEQGIIRVKFKESYARSIQRNLLPYGKFGFKDTDDAAKKVGVKSVTRIFRESGKYEKAHRAFGLHLWYEIAFDERVAVSTVLNAYNKLPEFEVVEDKKEIHAITPIEERVVSPTPQTISGETNDPQFNLQWHYENTGQSGGTAGADISLPQAWAVQTGSPSVIVAVIDGGIDIAHPDLTGSLWINENEIAGNAIDDDGNGYVDDINGYAFGDNTGTIRPHFHGTHVAGTIAAITNNSVGVSGIAGGSGAANGVRLMSCAGFGEFGTGGFEDAMVYAADNGAVISQNSWGGGSQAIEDAIDYFIARAGFDNSEENFDDNVQTGPMAGGLVVFAAGNSNTDIPSIGYPASYAPVMAVASTDHSDVRSYFSNYGSWVDIAAPGSNVYSTYPVSLGSYTYLSGTSMACPHVSGVAALIISEFQSPGFSPNEVWDRLQATADNIDVQNPSFVDLLGAGRVNAYQALQTEDDIPPATITDLVVVAPLLTSVKISWTAPGASGTEGVASAYEIRYSTAPLTAGNFSSATLVANAPRPKGAGTVETFEIIGLLSNTSYYVAMKARDFFGNVALLSNVVSAITLQPPVINITPASLTANLFAGESVTKNLMVTNNGLSDLLITSKAQQTVVPAMAIARSRVVTGQPPIKTKSIREVYTQKLQALAFEMQATQSKVAGLPQATSGAGRLFALNHATNAIQEYDTETGAVLRSISPPEAFSGGPDGLAYDGSYLYYISGWGSNDIHRIDIETGSVVSTLSLGSIPTIDGLAHSGKFVYALDYSNGVMYEIDFDEGEVVRTIDPGVNIGGGLSFGGSRGTIFVSDFSTAIYEIELETGDIINTLPTPGTVYGLGYSDALGILFVANVSSGTADAIDPDTGTKLYSLPSIVAAAMASDEAGNTWLRIPDDAPTVVSAGESVILPVLIDADGLAGGVYNANVIVSSNDPVTPTVNIPVSLTVTGAPNLLVTPPALEFADVFLNGTSAVTVVIKNNGTDVLNITSITIADEMFSVTDAEISLAAGQTYSAQVTFTPTAIGEFESTLTIESNDPDQPEFSVPITASCVLPPDIGVSPTEIISDLFVNEIETYDLVISNTGSAPLDWSLSFGEATTSSVWSAVRTQSSAAYNNSNETASSEVIGGPFQLAAGDFSARANSPAYLTCMSVNPATGKIYAQQNQGAGFYVFDPFTNSWSTLASAPLSSGNNGGAVFLNGKIYTIYTENSSTMGVYDVATNSWTTMSNSLLTGTANITTDGLSVYVLGGTAFKKYNPADNTWTGLASPPFSFQPWGGLAYNSAKIYGHQGNGYSGFARYDIATNAWIQLSNIPSGAVLGAAIDPVAGKYYTYGSYGGNNWYSYDFASNAWEINSIPLFNIHDGGLAYVRQTGVSGIYFTQGEAGLGFARFESEADWLVTDISSGIIQPGLSQTVQVTINSNGLSGGTYESELVLTSNDPDEAEIGIPVTLNVTGAPDISVSASELVFGSVFVGGSKSKNITITSQGTDNLVIDEIEIDGDGFTTTQLPFTLEPGQTKELTIVFSPATAGEVAGALTLVTNDPNESTVVIALTGEGKLPPIIHVTPLALEADLLSGEITTRTIAIQNTGASDLEWTLELNDLAVATSAVFAQTQSVAGKNNSGVSVSSDIVGQVPLGAGDFHAKTSSGVTLTCVTADPTTGYLYAQANDGTAFFRYSPSTNSWTTLASAPLSSGNNGGAAYLNGKIYTIYTSNGSSIGVYDIASNTWSTIANGLGYGTGDITTDGKSLYVAMYSTLMRYNVNLNQWTTLATAPISFTSWGGLKFLDGYIYGHSGNSGVDFARYNVGANTWSTLPSVPGGAVLGSAIDPSGKKYYAYGSYGGSNWYTYDIVSNAWSVSSIPFFSVNDGGMAFIRNGGDRGIYFVQGENGTGLGLFEVANTAAWLRTLVDVGTVGPGESQEVEITIDANALLGGEYEGSINITSNDPETSSIIVPVSLSVTGTGDINVHPTNINFGPLRVERNIDTSVIVQNTGTSNLFVSAFNSNNEVFTSFFTPFILGPGEAREVYVRFLPMTSGNFSGVFTIVSDDPDEPESEITVTGIGLSSPDLELSKETISLAITSGHSTSTTISLSNLGESELIWYRSVSAASASPAAQTMFVVEDKHEFPYVVNNAKERINTKLLQTIYPLASGDFTAKASSPAALTCVTADLATGYIYAQGKYGYTFYRYAPNTNQWLALNNAPIYSSANGGAVVLNNKIYTVYVDNSSTIGVYDIATDTWSSMPNGLFTGTMNITTDGQKLFLVSGNLFRSYDPLTNAWSSLLTPPFSFSRWGGIVYKDGMIYGHQGDGSTAFAQYFLRDGHWEILPSLPGGAIGGGTIDLQSNKYYTYGNYYGNSLYAFDLATRAWSLTTIPFFNVHNGGLAFIGTQGVSGVYFTQGEIGTGFGRFETQPLQHWLSATPSSGLIEGNNTNEVTVSIDAASMPGGTYNGTLTFVTNEATNGTTHHIPITLTVSAAPAIDIGISAIDYGQTYINSRKDSVVVIKNKGSEVLNITAIIASNLTFKVPRAPISILPGAEYTLKTSFAPNAIGMNSGTITINSNDPVNPSATLDVQGTGVASRFAVTPNALRFNLAPGTSQIHRVSIQNTFPETTQWNISVDGHADNALQGIRQSLSTSLETITNLIPGKYLFSEGESGIGISDGGGDMYDGGNYLSTNVLTSIPYTNGVIQTSEAFGPASRYFTVKHPGLFALVADCNIQRFAIDGNLGADGGGSKDGAVLTVVRGGRVFKGFVKRVYNAGDPSVNHLVIVENNGSAAHQFSNDTNNDFHQIDNLSGINRIYYLLFASSGGGYIDNASMEAIMNAFLTLTNGSTPWLSVSNSSGSLTANQTFSNEITVSSVNLAEGKYYTNVNIASNHGDEPFVVPVELNVGTFAEMEVSTTQVNFEEIYTNTQYSRNIIIRNNGAGSLTINDVSTSNNAFSASLSKNYILPGDSAVVTVTSLVSAIGAQQGILTITSNDPIQPLATIALSASAKNPPLAQLTSSSDSFEVFEGEIINVPLTLKNIGGSVMSWSLAALPKWIRSTANSGTLNIGEETVFMVTINTDGLPIQMQSVTMTINYNSTVTPNISHPLAVNVKLNHAPTATPAIPTQTIRLGAPVSLDLKLYFNDVDNHVLTYSIANAFQNLLSTEMAGATLKLNPKAIGEGFIFVNVKDQAGDSTNASFIFKILPANNPPEIVKPINDFTLNTGDKASSINLAEYFRDKDVLDRLRYGVVTPAVSVVDVSIVGSVFSIKPLSTGKTSFLVWAEDDFGARAQMEVNVEVKTITGIEYSSAPEIQVYPNPFTNATRFEYTLNSSSAVELTLFDVTGRPLVKLIDAVQIGNHTYELDGGRVASGIYFYHFKVNGKVAVIKKLIKR
jgi:subtilisin family serine protease